MIRSFHALQSEIEGDSDRFILEDCIGLCNRLSDYLIMLNGQYRLALQLLKDNSIQYRLYDPEDFAGDEAMDLLVDIREMKVTMEAQLDHLKFVSFNVQKRAQE